MSQFCVFGWHFLAHFGALCFFFAFFLHILEFNDTFWHFFCTIWVFLAIYTVLSWIRFVVIYALFWVKLFWLKPCLCKKVVFFHLCNWGPTKYLLFCDFLTGVQQTTKQFCDFYMVKNCLNSLRKTKINVKILLVGSGQLLTFLRFLNWGPANYYFFVILKTGDLQTTKIFCYFISGEGGRGKVRP